MKVELKYEADRFLSGLRSDGFLGSTPYSALPLFYTQICPLKCLPLGCSTQQPTISQPPLLPTSSFALYWKNYVLGIISKILPVLDQNRIDITSVTEPFLKGGNL